MLFLYNQNWKSKRTGDKTYHFLSEDGELQVEGGGWGRSGCWAAARVGAQALGQGRQSVDGGADGQHLHWRRVLADGDLAPRQTDRLPLAQLHPVRDPGGGGRRRRLPPHLAGSGRHRGRTPAARHLCVRPAIHAADTHTRQHSRRLSWRQTDDWLTHDQSVHCKTLSAAADGPACAEGTSPLARRYRCGRR